MTRLPFRLLIAIAVTINYSSVSAHNKVVVVPLDSSEKTSFVGEASISIPVTSLVDSRGNSLAFSSPLGVRLAASGVTSFGTSFIIPMDHKPGTRVFVDIYIYNPLSNGACQAAIRSNYGRSWHPGEERDQSSVFGFASAFPAFTRGEQTYVHTYRFGDDKGAGDSILFGMFRSGDRVEDNCGEVGVVGLNIRYQRE